MAEEQHAEPSFEGNQRWPRDEVRWHHYYILLLLLSFNWPHSQIIVVTVTTLEFLLTISFYFSSIVKLHFINFCTNKRI